MITAVKRLGLAAGFIALTGFGFTIDAAAQQKFKQIPNAGPRVAPVAPRARSPNIRRPEVKIKSKHGAWVVRCEKLTIRVKKKPAPVKKGGKGNKGDRAKPVKQTATTRVVEQCAMVQSLKAPKGQKVSMQVMFQKVKNKNGKTAMLLRMIVPLGVYLADGIGIQVDGKPVGRFPYTRCYPAACTATVPVRKDLMLALKKGQKATFFVYAMPGRSLNMPLDLKGFTKAEADL